MKRGTLLDLEGITVGYSGASVVRDLSLAVGQGEIVALLGPNGAGKSTTLRAISRLIPLQTGSIHFGGKDLATQSPVEVARAGLVHMTDHRSIFRSLTVEEHFRLAPRGQKLDRDVAYGYFPALKQLAGRRAGLLSGGEQQMLGLGRALARKPQLLLVDELSLGLAPLIVKRLMPIVRQFADDTGAGVLLVEQHVQMALEVADRACVLVHGDLALEGDAEDLLRNRELLTASYLGESRFEDAEAADDDAEGLGSRGEPT